MKEHLCELVNNVKQLNERIRKENYESNNDKLFYKIVENYINLGVGINTILDEIWMIVDKNLYSYLAILSTLYSIFEQDEILKRICVIEEVFYSEDFPYDLIVGVRKQILCLCFVNKNIQVSYAKERQHQKYIVDRLQSMLGIDLVKIPYEHRNHKCIVVTTDTLLSVYHAPTHWVLEIVSALQKELGYTVLLVVNIDEENEELLKKCWPIFRENYYEKEYMGKCKINYKGGDIYICQQIVGEKHREENLENIRFIQKWKPECVWDIGGGSAMGDLLGRMTTMLSMPCTSGYAVSEASVLVSCGLALTKEERNIRKYLHMQQQRCLSMQVRIFQEPSKKKVDRIALEIPINAFCITIMGNRLDQEISYEFIEVMQKIADYAEDIYFVIIGELTKTFEENLDKKVIRLGYRKDYSDIINTTQLFLNPVRQGGGTGGLVSIECEVPVVTLEECDVAYHVGSAFWCKNLDDMLETVKHYYDDKEFYKKQIEECKKRNEQFTTYSLADECRNVLNRVHDWIQNGIIV